MTILSSGQSSVLMCTMVDAKNSTSTVGPHSRSAFERFVYASLTLKLLDQIRTLLQFFCLVSCVVTFPRVVRSVLPNFTN